LAENAIAALWIPTGGERKVRVDDTNDWYNWDVRVYLDRDPGWVWVFGYGSYRRPIAPKQHAVLHLFRRLQAGTQLPIFRAAA